MSNKYDFSFNVSALTDFKNENTAVVQELMFSPTTIASGIELIVGQKGDFALNTLANDVYLSAAACGWTVDASNSVIFGQSTVELESLELKQALCPQTLTTKWVSQLMRAGSNPEELPFEQYIVDGIVSKLGVEIEKMFWRGNKSTGVDNLSLVDGMAKYLTGKGSIFVNDASGDITVSNVIDKVNALVLSMPDEILERTDLAIYMGPDTYRTYVAALIKSQYPIDNTSQTKPYGKSLMIPGYDIEAIMTVGLSGTGFMYATSKANLVAGTDAMSDSENIEVWYSKDNDEYRLKTTFKFGVGCYFPQFVAHNNPAITA